MTDDRIKETYVDDDLEDLANLRYKSDKESESAKLKRAAIAYVGFLISFFIVFYLIERPSSFGDYLSTLILSAVLSILYFLIGATVFWKLFARNQKDSEYIAFLERRIHFAEERIKNMTGTEIAELFAKRLWHYTDQFCTSAYISKPHDAAVVWASLLYYAHTVLDERKLTPLVKRRFKYTAPFLYARSFNAPDDCQAILHTMEDTLQSLLDNQISLERKQECEEFLTMHNISYFDQISAYLDALYNTKRYIRVILDVREHRNDGPQFPGPIPG